MKSLYSHTCPCAFRSSTTFNVGKWTDEDAYCGVCGDIKWVTVWTVVRFIGGG